MLTFALKDKYQKLELGVAPESEDLLTDRAGCLTLLELQQIDWQQMNFWSYVANNLKYTETWEFQPCSCLYRNNGSQI